MNKHLVHIINLWLVELNYKKNNDFSLWLTSHPDFPSLKSIKDTLKKFNIESIFAKIDLNTLLSFDKPFLALVSYDKGEQLTFAKVSNDKKKISLVIGDKKSFSLPINEFEEMWKNIVLVADENRSIRVAKRFILSNWLYKNALFLLIGLLLVTFLLVSNPSIYNITFFISTLIGFYFSILLIKKEFKIGDEVIDKFCNALPNSSCESVINSDQGKILKLSLSTICIIYFASILIYQLIFQNTDLIYTLGLLSIIPIIYSLYSQKLIVKQWCLLCLGTVSALFIGLLVSITYIYNNFSSFIITFPEIGIFSVNILFIGILYLVVKPQLLKLSDFDDLKIDALSYKRNYHLFMPFYVNNAKQIHIKEIPRNVITLGDTINPIIQLVAITNPMCNNCIKAHNVYKKMSTLKYNFLLSTLFLMRIERTLVRLLLKEY